MADCLRKLVTIRSFSLLQERLDRWNQTYKHNSDDENLANACELIELNARVQSQLFKLLSLCAAEGDLLGAHPATIRARLQPLLGPDFFESAAADQADDEDDDVPAGCLSADAALSVIANAGAARSHQQPACGAPGRRFVDVDEVKIAGAELDELEHDLRLMRRANDGIRAQALSDTVDRHLAQRGPPGPQSPLSLSHPWQQSRQQHLIARFNEAFTASRAEAMEALRFAFRSFKGRVRSHLIARRVGPDLLEEAVQDFINCHTDLYDLHTLVQEVLRCLSRNSRLYLPPGIGYDVIAPFVTECCRIAWEMTALAHPLDVAFSATGVSHHIWPALMQGSGLLMKGEACTRRGH
uniref:Mitochondria-eating protein n=1 Tax=Macrostomum lignano TaxID=282301 RepID=A0A1I8I9L8_9PLAT